MKKFLFSTFLFIIVFILIFEIFLRISGFATDIKERIFVPEDSMLVFIPNSKGKFTRGLRAEVNSDFSNNSQGWNSILNYDTVPLKSIAIIGDSYIEAGYTDVQNSLGRRVERLYPGITVHEYGMAGSNFLDYNNICHKISNKGYQLIIVNFGPKDLLEKKPANTQKTGYGVENSKILYRKFAILRYLNVNMNLLEVIIPTKEEKRRSFDEELLNKKFNELALPNIVYMHESEIPLSFKTNKILLKINHDIQPEDYGFNGHWNSNGYQNVANTIVSYLKRISF